MEALFERGLSEILEHDILFGWFRDRINLLDTFFELACQMVTPDMFSATCLTGALRLQLSFFCLCSRASTTSWGDHSTRIPTEQKTCCESSWFILAR
jgi:hypothetical protein